MKKIFVAVCVFLLCSLSAMAAVDLNKATQAELESVKGIGPAKAKAIIEYRQKNGGFKTVDELDNVTGFGKKTIDKIKQEITVGNATAAAAGKVGDLKSVKDTAIDKAATKLEKKAQTK